MAIVAPFLDAAVATEAQGVVGAAVFEFLFAADAPVVEAGDDAVAAAFVDADFVAIGVAGLAASAL